MMPRTLVVWCPDWPLTAAGLSPERPTAMVSAGRVTVCSAAARAVGVRIGLRRREAQARCPELVVVDADPDRDARGFDPVVAAAAEIVPAIEVVRPGLLACAVPGPARVFGGEEPLAARLVAVVDDAVHHTGAAPGARAGTGAAPGARAGTGAAPGARAGIADGRFAALLAARLAPHPPGLQVVLPGDVAFLAPLPITALAHDPTLASVSGTSRRRPSPVGELIELLRRLGLTTLGDLAALPRDAVGDRFGRLGERAHRLATGDDDQRVVPVRLPADRTMRVELDPPAEQVEAVAFAVRDPAERLVASLAGLGLACTLVAIEAESEHGERRIRRWRAHGRGFTPALLVERTRWQLDGWLTGSADDPPPTAGITLVRLVPEEVVEGGQQSSLLGEATTPDEVVRAVTRLQGLLGPDAVLVATPSDGRDPSSWVALTPFGQPPPIGREGPWPGRLPAPAPATVLPAPRPAEVVDDTGAPVGVSARGEASAAPARLRSADGPWRQITCWAGPWPADERWWDTDDARRRARFQLVTEDGTALLACVQDTRWHLEAHYD